MKKFNLIPVFFAVIMAVFFFASCEKEDVTNPVSENTWDANKCIAAATQQITVPVAHSNHKVIFEIVASDQTFLRNINASDISFKWLSEAELAEANDMQQPEKETKNNKIVGEKLDRNRFISIKLKEIRDVDSESDIRPYNVAFSQNLQNYLRDNKICLSLDFDDEILYFTGNTRACSGGCTFYNYNKSIALYGDGGIYYTYAGSAWSNYGSNCYTPLYDCYYSYGNCSIGYALNIHQCFLYSGRCSVCPYNTSKWVRKIWQDYDVLTGYSALSNSCTSSNTNIGYWDCWYIDFD